MPKCQTCGNATTNYGFAGITVCIECFKSDAGLLRHLIELQFFPNSVIEQDPAPEHWNVRIHRTSTRESLALQTAHFDEVGIDSVESAVARLINTLAEIDTKQLAAEIVFHQLLTDGISRGMGQDIGLPPSLAEYMLGVIASIEGGDYSEYSFYDILDQFTDVNRAIRQFQYDGGESPENVDSMLTTTAPIIGAFTTERFATGSQFRQAARMSYTPHKEKLEETVGFDIEEAITFTERLGEFWDLLYERLFTRKIRSRAPLLLYGDFLVAVRFGMPDKYDEFLPILKRIDSVSYPIDSLWVREAPLSRLVSSGSREKFDLYLHRMSVDIGTADEYRLPHHHNPLNEFPLLSSEDEVLSPLPGKVIETLGTTFYYDLLDDDDYRGKFGNKMGEFVEEWTENALLEVFDESEISRNVKHEAGETDFIVHHGETLLVIECKRKGLSLETRTGGGDAYRQIADEVSIGIGQAHSQTVGFLKLLSSRESTPISVDGDILRLSNDDYTTVVVCVILGDPYDMIGTTQYSDLLSFDQNFPYVVDIYNLETILRTLDDADQFLEYAQKRIDIAKNLPVYSPDELDYLYEFLESGFDFSDAEPFEFLSITNPGNDLRDVLEDVDYDDWTYSEE